MSTPLRVLILEDRAADAEMVLYELRRAGYEPDWRRVDAEPDYLACLTPGLDVILADYTLPQFDALRALRHLQDHNLDIPFIVVTATVSEEVAVECMKQGATDYLLKDRMGRLGPAVEHALQQRRLRDEKERVDDALRESEERFRRLAENAQDIIYRYELVPRRRFAYVSPAVTLITGYTPADYYADPDLMLRMAHPDDRPLIGSTVRKDRLPKTPHTQRWVRKDGTIIWMEQLNVPIYDSAGELVAVEGVARDVTERKRAEEEVKKLNRDLERRARELAALYQAGQIMASTLQLDRLLGLVMKQVKSLLDAEAASVLLHTAVLDQGGDELVFAAAISPSSEKLIGVRLPVTAGIAGWVMREKQSVSVADTQSDPRFFSGVDTLTGMTTRSLLAVPLLFQDTALGVLEVVNKINGAFDEHDLKMLEALASSAAMAIENARLYQAQREALRRLQESQAQLVQAEKMTALGRLVASIIHEVNNPLQAMQNALELAVEELEDGLRRERLSSYLGMALTEIERLTGIMRRLRDFYRPGRQEMRPTDVYAVLRDVLELAGKQLQHSHVTVECDWAAELPAIQANPDYLKQVFLNLVLNAIDAMSAASGEGRPAGVLRVRTLRDKMQTADGCELPAVRLEFCDTGVGMPPEILPHIFEPFMTTKATGTGLGLSISYGIIEAHGGQITVSSEAGAGTTFTILLPVSGPQT
ncbi:MAG: PAS domain S-box protein [Thermoflexales bacterium]|nr:PAS domain S-box protein [Thermoflexales bacterium]